MKDPGFPCVGAKSALSRGQMRFVVARDIRSAWDDLRIYPNLLDLAQTWRRRPRLFQTLVVIFRHAPLLSEKGFEEHLWRRLQSLSDKDAWHGQAPDERVSTEPGDPHFSLSFGGEAFFVVGMHPRASRPARRFEAPAMVFNLHDQFEQLRQTGQYARLKQAIRARDVALAGGPNPMVADFGEVSEARQYSGRRVEPDWACPFLRSSRDAA